MATKYMLVRKSKKGNWKPCALLCVSSNNIGDTSEDKAAVETDRERLQRMFPANKYAVLEVTED